MANRANRLTLHLRWFCAAGAAGGSILALGLLVPVVVRIPFMVTDSGAPLMAIAGVLAASLLCVLALVAPVFALGAWFDAARGWSDRGVARVYRIAGLGGGLGGALALGCLFLFFEGNALTGRGLGAAAVAFGVGLAGGALLDRLWEPRGAPSLVWLLAPVLAFGVAAVPRPAVEAPPAPSTAESVTPADHLAPPPGAPPRTVLLITLDTLRADHMGSYGYPRETTPNLDRLAEEGVVFDYMLAATSATVGSTATILTGLHPGCSGVVNQTRPLPQDALTLAERFRSAGYATVGAVSNGLLSEASGFDQGFDAFDNLAGGANADAYAPHLVARALELVDEAPADRPLFAWVHFIDPHTPYAAGEDVVAPFIGDELYSERPLRRVRLGTWRGVNAKKTLHRADPGGRNLEEGFVDARYDGDIVLMDRGVGDLLEGFRERGRLDDALVFVTADHGETLADHDTWYQHGLDVYDSTVRVPAIAWDPARLPAGLRVDTLVRHVDITPTLVRLSGLGAGAPTQGGDLLAEPSPSSAVTQSAWWDGLSQKLLPLERRRPIRALVQGDWKLVVQPHHELAEVRGPLSLIHAWRSSLIGQWQPHALFQRSVDPGEQHNRIEDEPERARAMRAALADFVAQASGPDCPLSDAARDTGPDEVSEELEERLRALGYLD